VIKENTRKHSKLYSLPLVENQIKRKSEEKGKNFSMIFVDKIFSHFLASYSYNLC